jgi:glycosyltransferase involved in cell wall biosynthesis
VRPADRESDIRELARFCRSVETVPIARSRLKDARDGVQSLFSETPFLIRRDQSSAMSARLRTLVEQHSFDAVHADQLWMAPYAAECGVPLKILDQHNAVFKVPERMAAYHRSALVRMMLRREASKLAQFERATFDRFNRVVWVSDDDRRAFPDASINGTHRTIPIAVDTNLTVPVQRSRPFRVTFLGGIHWPPNAEGVRWFADEVWPEVAREVPDAVFTIIGKGDLGRLGRADLRSRMDVTGYVPDLARYLAETAVFVVPLRSGAGMRVKILDAWSWALPIVSTSIGAEGIQVAHGQNVLLSDDPGEFADSVTRVLQDRALARTLAANGRDTVQALYDWRKVYQAWDQVYH